jgi:Fe-S cluster biogenesis protein NfuA
MQPDAIEPQAEIDPHALATAISCIRPLLRGHGGDLDVVGIVDGVVTVAFRGACEACPNISMTYVGPVRTALLRVPGVREVRSADVHASPGALARIARALGAASMPL